MIKFLSTLQVIFIILTAFYLYNVNYRLPLFRDSNQVLMISLFASVLAFFLATIIKLFLKLKQYKNK
ncbi:MAG: hypothetical protein H6604_00910 [Flavobacteriales bacterium]|nr:hypothetical protein [Flavobacteriales bacterium]